MSAMQFSLTSFCMLTFVERVTGTSEFTQHEGSCSQERLNYSPKDLIALFSTTPAPIHTHSLVQERGLAQPRADSEQHRQREDLVQHRQREDSVQHRQPWEDLEQPLLLLADFRWGLQRPLLLAAFH